MLYFIILSSKNTILYLNPYNANNAPKIANIPNSNSTQIVDVLFGKTTVLNIIRPMKNTEQIIPIQITVGCNLNVKHLSVGSNLSEDFFVLSIVSSPIILFDRNKLTVILALLNWNFNKQ